MQTENILQVDTMQTTLNKERRRVERTRAQNKEIEKDITNKIKETETLNEDMHTLEQKRKDWSEKAASAAGNAQMIEQLLQASYISRSIKAPIKIFPKKTNYIL
jgi:TolA-binding protein